MPIIAHKIIFVQLLEYFAGKLCILTFLSKLYKARTIKLVKLVFYLLQTQPHCLLPRLLDQLIVPLHSNKKAMLPAVLQCVKAYLHWVSLKRESVRKPPFSPEFPPPFWQKLFVCNIFLTVFAGFVVPGFQTG